MVSIGSGEIYAAAYTHLQYINNCSTTPQRSHIPCDNGDVISVDVGLSSSTVYTVLHNHFKEAIPNPDELWDTFQKIHGCLDQEHTESEIVEKLDNNVHSGTITLQVGYVNIPAVFLNDNCCVFGTLNVPTQEHTYSVVVRHQ